MYEKSSESKMFATFGLIVEKVTIAHAPSRTKTIKQKLVSQKKPWIDESLMSLINLAIASQKHHMDNFQQLSNKKEQWDFISKK